MICFEYDPQTPYWGLKDSVSFQFFIFREYVLALRQLTDWGSESKNKYISLIIPNYLYMVYISI